MNWTNRVFRLILMLVLGTFLASCSKFYKNSLNDTGKQKYLESSNQEQWEKIDFKNHLVVHVDQEMYEIYSLQYDPDSRSIRAWFKSFEGPPLEGYLKVLEKKKQRTYRRKGIEVEDVQQVHLFLNSYDKLNDSKMMFSVSDIFQVDVTKQAKGLNVTLTTVPAAVAGGSAFIGFIFIYVNSWG